METEFDVKDKARISWVIQSLMQAHQLVDINFGEDFEPSQSIIVEIDAKSGYFFLDEFPTDEANRLAGRKNRFVLRGALDGVRVKAPDLKVEKIQNDEKGLLYKVPLPKHLLYMQRRNSYRQSIGYGIAIPVDITFLELPDVDTNLEPTDHLATLSDISTTGCRLIIPGGEASFSEEPGQVWQLNFKLPEADDPVQLTIETCHAQFISRTRDWQFGCRFNEVEGATLEKIGKFVTDMQRKERSRQNGLG